MDRFIINPTSGKPLKIGGKTHRHMLITKIRDGVQIDTVMINIEHNDYKRIKKSLPPLPPHKFYSFDRRTKSIITKNKSIRPEQLIRHICDQLPNIIDRILDEVSEDDDRDKIKLKMIECFHKSIL